MAKKILIVDDNEKNRKLLRFMLRSLGYETAEAENGEAAVRLACEIAPDLILMDIQMPVMNGLDAMKALRASPETSGMCIIAVTSYAMKGDRERFLHDGFDGYVPKPLDVDGILSSIKAAMGEP